MKKINVYVQIKELEHKDKELEIGEEVFAMEHSDPKFLGTFGGWGRESVKLLNGSEHSKICHGHYWVKRQVLPVVL